MKKLKISNCLTGRDELAAAEISPGLRWENHVQISISPCTCHPAVVVLVTKRSCARLARFFAAAAAPKKKTKAKGKT